MRCLPFLLFAMLVASCASLEGGSSTTSRPALTRPAIEPDGAFWDAVVVAEKGDIHAFLFLLSPRMVYRALFPDEELAEVTSQAEFDKQRADIEEKLEPFQVAVQRLASRYMQELQELLRDRFVEVSKPSYTIQHKDSFDRADGPNAARVTVTIFPKSALPKDFEPAVMEVLFVQDGRRWLIDSIGDDKLKGAFVR